MATIGELVANIRFAVKGVQELQRADKGVKSISSNMKDLARTAGAMGAALAGGTFLFGRTILGIQASQNRLAATFLETADATDLRTLNEQAFILGSRTSRTISDATNAQVAFARAGFSVNDTFAATPNVLNLAIAGELQMGEAAKLAANQLRAFKLEAAESARVADVLARAASLTNTTVGELGPALRNVAPAASAFKLSLEEVVAGVGSLRNIGMIPEQAGTALRNFFLRLLTDNEEIKKDFIRLGTTNEEVIETLVTQGLSPTMALLSNRGDISVADRLMAFRNIFGQRTIAGALELSSIVPRFRELQSALEGAAGSADAMRTHIESRLPGAVIRLKSAFEGAVTTMGEAGFTGALIKIINAARQLLLLFIDLPGPVKTFVGVGLIALTGALLVLSAALGAALFLWHGTSAAIEIASKRTLFMTLLKQRLGRTIATNTGITATNTGVTGTNTGAQASNALAVNVRTGAVTRSTAMTVADSRALTINTFVGRLSRISVLAQAFARLKLAAATALTTTTTRQASIATGIYALLNSRLVLALRAVTVAMWQRVVVGRVLTIQSLAGYSVLVREGGLLRLAVIWVRTHTVALAQNTGARIVNMAATLKGIVIQAAATAARIAGTVVIGAATVATLALAAATWVLNIALLALPLLAPLLLLAGFIAFWAGMGFLVYKFRNQIVDVFRELKEWIMGVLSSIGDFFVNVADWVRNLAQLVVREIKNWFSSLAEHAKSVLNFIVPGADPFTTAGRAGLAIPAAAPPPGVSTSSTRSSTSNVFNNGYQNEVNIGEVQVIAEGGDSATIARTVKQELQREFANNTQETATDVAQ